MARFAPSCLAAIAVLALSSAPARAQLPEIVERAAGSIVGIEVTAADVRPSALQRFVAGWVFDPAGHVVTSASALARANGLRVRLDDGRVFPARVRGTDDAVDVAVLEVEGARLNAMPLGRADLARLGEPVSAVTRTADGRVVVRAGILSSRGGLGTPLLDDDLRPDAALEPGFVGAPLLDAAGRALGLLTLRAPGPPLPSPVLRRGRIVVLPPRVAPEPHPSAVPVDLLSEAVRQILANGRTEWPWLGIALRQAGSGRVEVASAEPGSPAASAGLTEGDAVSALDGRRVRTIADVQRHVLLKGLGQRIALTYARAGATQSVDLVTRPRPSPR